MVFFWTKNGSGWCERFSREKAYHDKGRKLVKNLLQNLKLNRFNFRLSFIGLHWRNKYSLCQVSNADETEVFWHASQLYCKFQRGKPSVNENHRSRIKLHVTVNCNKLPPYVILERKSANRKFLQRHSSLGPKNARITLELIENWLACVLERQPGVLSKPQSTHAMEAFCGHFSNGIRNRLMNKNTDPMIIPNGMTSWIQPLDVTINKPFKHQCR
jgi:hypothetical protein